KTAIRSASRPPSNRGVCQTCGIRAQQRRPDAGQGCPSAEDLLELVEQDWSKRPREGHGEVIGVAVNDDVSDDRQAPVTVTIVVAEVDEVAAGERSSCGNMPIEGRQRLRSGA